MFEKARSPRSSSKARLLTRSRGCNATTVARGPSFFSLLLRKAGGWIVSRRRSTAWMEGILAAAAAAGRLLSLCGGLPPSSGGSPPYNCLRVCHGVLLPLRKGPSHRWGVRRRAVHRALLWGPPDGSFMV